MSTNSDRFPTDAAGLPEAHEPEVVELADGDEFDLSIEQECRPEIMEPVTIGVTLSDDSYLKKYPAEYERWG